MIVPSFQYDYRKLCEDIIPNCKYISVKLATVTLQSLSTVLDQAKKTDEINCILEIRINQPFSKYINDFNNAMAPRPWWVVKEQPYENSDALEQSIVLQRLPSNFLTYSQYITDINFPNNSISCKDRPMFFSPQTGTWGNGLLNMQNQYNHYSRAVFVPFTTKTMSKTDRVFLADENACPQIMNKWECLFLSPTSCPWSDVVQCQTPSLDCLPYNKRGCWSSAASGSEVITDETMNKRLAAFPVGPPHITGQSSVIFQSNDPQSIVTTASTISINRGGEAVLSNHFLFGVATRFNGVFRGLVQEVIRDFRAAQSPIQFHPNMTCVAIHVRRDDRAIPDMDMIEWCKNHTIMDKNGQMKPFGHWIDGTKLNSGQWMNMGCNKRLPFGAVTLEHFLNASRVLLPHNRNVFMMTDDPKWLQNELKKYYAHSPYRHINTVSNTATTTTTTTSNEDNLMNIFTPTIRPNHRSGTFNSSIDFWASVTMARQCRALVGHFGSAAFMVIYHSLCYYHDNTFFQCPPVYNMAG
mmetsp:Transcript_22622/g.32522  ORF Transcript_22622/g.32522 Transcript_22622/m.32522 type:complete len:524 (+) Transcript_22622:96-1667(+)